MDYTRLVFVVAYIIIDLVYVVLSKPVYDLVVKSIQGEFMRSLSGIGSYIAFFGAYTCMALGWYFLAAGTGLRWSKTGTMSPMVAGTLAGLVFGLSVIGTFNFTLYLMFKNYNAKIVMRDMLWGVGWPTVITMIYVVFVTRKR